MYSSTIWTVMTEWQPPETSLSKSRPVIQAKIVTGSLYSSLLVQLLFDSRCLTYAYVAWYAIQTSFHKSGHNLFTMLVRYWPPSALGPLPRLIMLKRLPNCKMSSWFSQQNFYLSTLWYSLCLYYAPIWRSLLWKCDWACKNWAYLHKLHICMLRKWYISRSLFMTNTFCKV